MRLYVGNISWGTSEDGLKNYFGQCGEVQSARIIKDRDTGKSRGFGFVDMDNGEEAIRVLNGKELDGRPLKVNQARDKSTIG